MKKFIREYAPFIMLGYSLIFAVLSYFDFYKFWYDYLSQSVGFSLFTSFYMYAHYANRKYCDATKIAVYGLMLCNLVALFCVYFENNKESYSFEINNDLYDIFIILIVFIVMLFTEIKKIMNEVTR